MWRLVPRATARMLRCRVKGSILAPTPNSRRFVSPGRRSPSSDRPSLYRSFLIAPPLCSQPRCETKLMTLRAQPLGSVLTAELITLPTLLIAIRVDLPCRPISQLCCNAFALGTHWREAKQARKAAPNARAVRVSQ